METRKLETHPWICRTTLSIGLTVGIFLFPGLLTLTSCKRETYPKPIAYPRIAYPEPTYRNVHLSDWGISFEYPTYARLDRIPRTDGKRWMSLRFLNFPATLHASRLKVAKDSLQTYLAGNERLVFEQAPAASEVHKEEFDAADGRFTGYFYLTDGNAPCPVQFILSDLHGNLFQGNLVFDIPLNRDSLAPVLDGMTRDLRHLVETFHFKP